MLEAGIGCFNQKYLKAFKCVALVGPDRNAYTFQIILYFSRDLGKKMYELSNHLGNVLTTVSDIKLTADANADGVVDSYAAVITSAQDYYPFGSLEPGRTYSSENYRFGFNGKENDNEVKGTGNQQDYGMRIYDPRIARFLSADPLIVQNQEYPELSPYQFASNTPIQGIDLDGLEVFYMKDGTRAGQIGDNTEVRIVKDDYTLFQAQAMINGANKGTICIANISFFQSAYSYDLGVKEDVLLAFASVIHHESSGDKDESYAIGNVTQNFIDNGGSVKDLKSLEDVVLYRNSFARGATQDNYSDFKAMTPEEQNSRYSIGAAINAIGYSKHIKGFKDVSNGATGWDGTDLIRYFPKGNGHRSYTWSSGSKDLLQKYMNNFGDGTVDVNKWKYSDSNYAIEAKKIIGKTLYEKLNTARGEGKTDTKRFQ